MGEEIGAFIGGIIILAFLAAAFFYVALAVVAILIGIGLLYVCYVHYVEIATAFGWILLAPHLAGASLVLVLGRDLVVYLWPLRAGGERKAIFAWTVVLPVLLALAWFAGVLRLGEILGISSLVVSLSLAFASTCTVVVTYYHLYFTAPPRHYNWPRFVAEEEHTFLDTQLVYIEQRTRLKLWWTALWR